MSPNGIIPAEEAERSMSYSWKKKEKIAKTDKCGDLGQKEGLWVRDP
jgi:hypothetical protein